MRYPLVRQASLPGSAVRGIRTAQRAGVVTGITMHTWKPGSHVYPPRLRGKQGKECEDPGPKAGVFGFPGLPYSR